jgi:hypothetical protein
MYLLPYLTTYKYNRVCLPSCNPYLVKKCCSNLVVESRDEILFKGARL